jgi:hypothetical protein
VQGPFDQEKLQNFSRRGQLSRMHEVSTDGINWARASTFPELFAGPVVETTVAETASAEATVAETTVTEASVADARVAEPPLTKPTVDSPPLVAAQSNPAPPPLSAAASAPANWGASSLGTAKLGGARAEWWYSLQGKQQGPVEIAVLQQMTASGQLGQHDFVWKSGMAGWREAAEILGLTFSSTHPPRSDFQSSGAGVAAAALDETLFATALGLRPPALLLAVSICLTAGGCCLWSLWQFFCAAVRDTHAGWSLCLGALGLIESGLLAAVAILLSIHAGRLAGVRHSRQPVVLEKALAALRPFWILSTIALLLGLVLAALYLATLTAGSPPPPAAA